MNNTLIECSDDSYSQAQNTYIVKSFLWKGPPTVKVRKKIIDHWATSFFVLKYAHIQVNFSHKLLK